MNHAQWERLKDLFQAALDQPASARRDWLRQQCPDDRAIVREAEALLDAHETAGAFLEQPAQVDPADLETLTPGARIGNYVVIEELGRGGMGVVYLAEDQRLGRRVALKSLPTSVASSLELRQRLRREARAAATISHPGVAVVYALEEIDEHLFIASEYVSGESLRAVIARGPIVPARVQAMALEIASALAAAHAAGVIHRDLKPENVLITGDGRIKIVDFGIAQIEGPEATRLTRAGAMLGTPAYMAPEQLLGGTVDGRADLYAVGVVLSEMLTGRHPLRSGGSPVPTGPLAAIIARCTQGDPAARFASARELLSALEGGAAPDTVGPAEAGRYERERAGPHVGGSRFWWEFHVQLVVDDPDVLLFVVGTDLDLVRSATTGILREHLVEMRPLVDQIALLIEHDDRVLEPSLPSAFRLRLTGCGKAVRVAGGIAARRLQRRVRRPRRGVLRQRQLAAHRHPDAIRILGVHTAERSPRPSGVRVTRVGERLRPALDHLVVAGGPILMTVARGLGGGRRWRPGRLHGRCAATCGRGNRHDRRRKT